MEIILNDGKYKIVLDDERIYALRYGREWRELTGDNLILSMLQEIVRLRDIIKEENINA